MDKQRGERLFTEAQRIINGERRDQYGDPEDSFKTIASLWNKFLVSNGVIVPGSIRLNEQKVTFMMVLLKVAREMHKHKRDNLVDMAGYLGLLDDMETNEPE